MNIFALIILLMLLILVIQAVRRALTKQTSARRFGLSLVASACLVVGAFGFFGTALSSTGALNFLPRSFEWPNYGSDEALQLASGEFVVPHTASGRVQVYDTDLEFVRGWTISASGGAFALTPSEGTRFYVYTARQNRKLEYDVLGNLLSSSGYGGAYPRENSSHRSVELKASPFLWPFTDPFAAWLFAAVGIGLAVLSDKLKAREE